MEDILQKVEILTKDEEIRKFIIAMLATYSTYRRVYRRRMRHPAKKIMSAFEKALIELDLNTKLRGHPFFFELAAQASYLEKGMRKKKVKS